MPRKLHRLLVVSHVVHYRHASRLYAYGPYAREIDIWADLFPEVVIAAPCRDAPPPGDAVSFTRSNISVAPQPETGGDTLAAKAAQVAKLPRLIWSLSKAMRRADAIHVRCPGNLGLLGVVLAPLFSQRVVAKYAGQWNGYAGEPLTVRLQRRLLRSRWWHGPVTVYGKWPNQPTNIVPFFTSMMTAEQVTRAAEVAGQKSFTAHLRILFSGRLAAVKRVNVLLDAVKLAVEDGVDLQLMLVGDGPERQNLQDQVEQLGIRQYVTFVGALPFDEALRWNEWAHCLVLPSVHSEGWPKVVAEGMCYGLVCIAVAHGQVPAMLENRGILLETGSSSEIANALRVAASDPAKSHELGQRASEWARKYSLEGLREALRQLLEERWQVSLAGPSTSMAAPGHEPESLVHT